MSSLFDLLAIALAGAGVLVLTTTWLVGWAATAPITLDLWTASGLLRLAGDPDWSRIAAVAAIIAVRRLVSVRGRWLSRQPGRRRPPGQRARKGGT